MENMFFDSHCHLNHEQFQENPLAVWEESQTQGVNRAIVIGYDIASSRKAIELTEQTNGLYACVGISPHDNQSAPSDYIQQLEELAQHPNVAALGETGLEYNYDVGPKDQQQRVFKEQIQLANRLQKILVIHLRDADEDFLHCIEDTPPDQAILHCFTASEDVMRTAVKKGYYISLSGIVTFKNAKEIHRIVPMIPDANLLIETDSPYLAPVPYRGKTCLPWMIKETAQKIAELRGEDLQTIAEKTYKNAQRAFSV